MTRETPRAEPTIASDAPVVSAAELEIDAPIDSVWSILTAVERWPAWNPDVRAVSLAGPFAEGSTFRWKAGPGTITSIVEHVDPPTVLAWSGRTLGIRAAHVWHLSAQNGKTLVRTEESYDGLTARVLRRSLQRTLDAALANGARCLKVEAERIASTTES
jgi:uncharacterized protein YndB with AHSA1/START domain